MSSSENQEHPHVTLVISKEDDNDNGSAPQQQHQRRACHFSAPDEDPQKMAAAAAAASGVEVPNSSGEGMCLACHKAPIEYMTSTCGHKVFCKRCAMKCASGGKCKICGQLYPDFKRI